MVSLTRAPIALPEFQTASPADGALVLFAGVVRDHSAGKRVLYLEYEAYEEMAIAEMERIEAEVRQRWPVTDVRIVHRLGRLAIGDASVAVAVASPHRREAFEACRFAIDTLKKTAPIWKKEFYEDGAVWLEGPAAT